jgi:hypothetical protein
MLECDGNASLFEDILLSIIADCYSQQNNREDVENHTSDIITNSCECVIVSDQDRYKMLKNLSKISNFNLLVSFVSNESKQKIIEALVKWGYSDNNDKVKMKYS